MSEGSACGPFDERLEQRLAVLKAEFPGGSGRDFRLSLVRELRENTPLSFSAARQQAEGFLRRRGYETTPEPPGMVLLGILMLGVMVAMFVAPVFTLLVSGLLVVFGHPQLAARCWAALLLGSGTCVGAITMLWCGPPMWRSYRRSLDAQPLQR